MICDHTRQVDVRQLGKNLPEKIQIGEELVAVTTTPVHFGGFRYWFLCPTCERRCAIIYQRPGARLFCCRVCGNGRYKSEHKSPRERKLQKAIKLRERLGQVEGGIVAPFPGKPPNMRWHTYLKIRALCRGLERELWQASARAMGW